MRAYSPTWEKGPLSVRWILAYSCSSLPVSVLRGLSAVSRRPLLSTSVRYSVVSVERPLAATAWDRASSRPSMRHCLRVTVLLTTDLFTWEKKKERRHCTTQSLIQRETKKTAPRPRPGPQQLSASMSSITYLTLSIYSPSRVDVRESHV
jgi:hypothetical protein